MTDSVRERVLAAMLTALEGITSVYGLDGHVHRNLEAEVEHFPTLILVDGDEQADEENFNGFCQCFMTVAVEGHVRLEGGSATNIGSAINALYAATEAALLADRTLGGVAVNILKQGCEVDVNRGTGQQPQGAFAATYTVQYFHRSGDPTTLAA